MKENIWAQNGVVTYTEYDNCTIEHDGIKALGIHGTFEGRHYGLIKYTCDKTVGYIMSHVSCLQCGVYCPINDNIEGCQHKVFPYLIGVILGILATMLTYFLITKALVPLCSSAYWRVKAKIADRRNKKENKRANRVANRIIINEMLPLNPVVALTLMALLFGTVLSCDNTLYMSSSGSVCDNNGCVNTNMYDLSLESGSTLCFRDDTGDIMMIRLKRAFMAYRSMLVYYTSDYQLEVREIWECKGAGQCWNKGCNIDTVHKSLNVSQKVLTINGYGCITNTLGCDTWCWHQTSCAYFRWTLKSIGNLYPIYKIVNKMWGVNIEVVYKNKTNTYKLDVNNPRFDLNEIHNNKVSILVNGFSSQEEVEENYYIGYNDKFYNTKASMINMPERDNVGDLQIDTRFETITMNEDSVRCYSSSCKTQCIHNEPRVNRLLRKVDNYLTHEGTFLGDKTTLLTTNDRQGIVRVMLGNIKLDSLRVVRAKCDLNVIGTYSCEGCSIKPYAVIQASSISEPGIIEFSSNCTFEKSYLSCSIEPYKMVPTTKNKICNIFVGSLNKTIIINFDYGFIGGLEPSKYIISKGNDIEDYTSLLLNNNLWYSLSYSWLSLSIFSLISTMIIKNIRTITSWCAGIIAIRKVEKSESNEHQI